MQMQALKNEIASMKRQWKPKNINFLPFEPLWSGKIHKMKLGCQSFKVVVAWINLYKMAANIKNNKKKKPSGSNHCKEKVRFFLRKYCWPLKMPRIYNSLLYS